MFLTIVRYVLIVGIFSGVQYFAWEAQARASWAENLRYRHGYEFLAGVFPTLRRAIWTSLIALVGAELGWLTGWPPGWVNALAALLALFAYALASHMLALRIVELRAIIRAHRPGGARTRHNRETER